jgi:GNAT superfamily N-acetyltransferase
MSSGPRPRVASLEVVDGALTRELRRRVLRPELSPADPLPGDDLAGVVHLAVLSGGQAVSTGWIVEAACPWLGDERVGLGPGGPLQAAWQLRQMATLESRRGEGLASAVVLGALAMLRSTAPDGLLWCYARERAEPLYAKLGFRSWGPLFTDEDHHTPHRRMWRRLADSSADSGAGPTAEPSPANDAL